MDGAIRVDGLRDFTRDLKKLDNELPKAVRLALNTAADLVVGEARPRVPTLTGRARGSMRAASTRTAARVKAGGRRAPHYPWLDFGGAVGRNRSVTRPFRREGRYLYDSYYDLAGAGKFQDVLSEALVDVARQAGVEVT